MGATTVEVAVNKPRHTLHFGLVDASVVDPVATWCFIGKTQRISNDCSNDDPIDFMRRLCFNGRDFEIQGEDTYSDQDDGLQLLMTMDVVMMSMGRSRKVTSIHKTMDNSQVDLAKNNSTHFCFRRRRLCQQVHDFGKCEAFNELAKILRTNVDKKNISRELQNLAARQPRLGWSGHPQSTDLVIDAECLYAFTGKCKWPEDNNNSDNKYMWSLMEKVVQSGADARQDGEVAPSREYGMVVVTEIRPTSENASSRAGTSVLLDTGANVSIIPTKLARRHVWNLIKNTNDSSRYNILKKEKMSTTTRVTAKFTLGRNRVY
ncbi:hypothetical protein PHMEG_00021143 [Phytophthora megakarya]|uniref:Peptidase A2 domain-containing protein n=1 Tax=Phytophthora megakarya TaxID=4795 RepID=A0A225VML3_9STRA|nr:hypothetical protein PHMEG_00021143 [Phytophthora megakarya]